MHVVLHVSAESSLSDLFSSQVSSNFFDDPGFKVYERAATYSLSALYGVLFFVSSVQLLLTLLREQTGTSFFTSQKLTLLTIATACLMRAVFFGIISDLFRPSIKIFDLLWTQPALFLWTAFSLIAFHWASVHFQQQDEGEGDKRSKLVFRLVLWANVALYGAQAVMYILLFVVDDSDESFASGEPILLSVAFLLSCVFVLLLGVRMLCCQRHSSDGAQFRRVQRRGTMVVAVLSLAFLIRAITNPFWHVAIATTLDGATFFVFLGFFYLLVEVIPLAVVLGVAHRVPRRSVALATADRAGLFFQAPPQFDIQDARFDDEDGFFRDDERSDSFSGFDVGAEADLMRSADRLKLSLAASSYGPPSMPASLQRDARMFAVGTQQ
jgi:hypothetical protein